MYTCFTTGVCVRFVLAFPRAAGLKARTCGYVVTFCGSGFVVTGAPLPRRFATLPRVSNQNGAPKDVARTVISSPNNFIVIAKAECGASQGHVVQPIGSARLSAFATAVLTP